MRAPHPWMRLLLGAFAALLMAAPLAHAEGGAGGSGAAWWDKAWPFRKQVTIDTTAKGVEIRSPIGRAPVLLRLHSGVFQFKDAQDAGQDLRFIGADGKTPLAYHIESFDPKAEIATIWLDMPEYPAGGAKSIWMYYGNKTAPVAQDGAGTFDPNYVLVYHFDGAGTQAPKDKTAYASNATSSPAGPDAAGVVGQGARFGGQGGVTVPAAGATAFKAGEGFTISAWVKPDAPGARQALVVRRAGQASVVLGLDNGVPFVEAGGARTQAPGALARGQWAHVAVVADGKALTLFVAGRTVASVPAATADLGGDIGIGADVAGGAGAGGAGLTPYIGSLDEVRVSKTARPAALIYADAVSQGSQSKLVDFGVDEKDSGVGFGLFGVIVKSVDATAWGVISVLMLMLAGGIYVIYTKVAYANVVDRANNRFLAVFREHGDDPLALLDPRIVDEPTARRLAPSPLYRLYRSGADEIARRERNGFVVLRTEGMEVVRALMDTTLVRENQRLSAALVVLTICISGGPFLGLLGTVVGVMITFAAIAQAGDVNVNAIAPGISAALLATVAGLFVAIPALFGYNYILLRNKNITSNMQVFVGEFITRAFETYSDPDLAMAAE